MSRGLVHLYCGDGKGKTTAAMGLAVRAAGSGMQVVVVQFLKDGDSSELSILSSLPNVTVLSGKPVKGFSFSMTPEEKALVAKTHNEYLETAIALYREGMAQLIVLDEAVAALSLNMLNRERLFTFLRGEERPEVVLTGRGSDSELQELADYITEMTLRRHPYDRGIMARKGIEY